MAKANYICIDGVIGVGKTTLANMLAQRLHGSTMMEIVEENPFLASFYEDPIRYAFPTQLFFLLSRYRQQQELWQHDLFETCIISDYLFSKDKIFAYLNLSEAELLIYEKVLVQLEKDIVKPDIVIYLKSNAERLMSNIYKRGRSFERNMSREYIERLNRAYNQFFNHYNATKLLTINCTEIDFVNNEEDFEIIVKQLEEQRCY
ncbi:deoxynucleoside kinase [candidate division KSB1 bacterium]|nr:deoxynucleoside kinase [candidate division KSB1 bacterium]